MTQTKQNKVFQIELCQEDAERILIALELLRSKVLHLAQTDDPCHTNETPWLEYSYVSELLNDMEHKLDIDQW